MALATRFWSLDARCWIKSNRKAGFDRSQAPEQTATHKMSAEPRRYLVLPEANLHWPELLKDECYDFAHRMNAHLIH
jgi:hypothetical protein